MRNLKGCQKAYSITPFFFFFFFLFIWGHEELAHQPEEGIGWVFEFKFWTLFLQIVFWEFFLYLPKISLTFVKYMCFRSTSRGIPTKSTPFPLVAMCRTLFFFFLGRIPFGTWVYLLSSGHTYLSSHFLLGSPKTASFLFY